MSGAGGQMGRAAAKVVSERADCAIVGGVSKKISVPTEFPVVDAFSELSAEADVIIDFSNPELIDSLLAYATEKKMPAVICTTGFNEAQIEKIKAASERIAIFFSSNMSLGVNLMISLAQKAAKALSPGFDIEIVEKHHNRKIDAPSGTALMIAGAVKAALGQNLEYVYDRHLCKKARSKNEVGIHSVRGGTMVGEHEIIFAGKDEVLKISHTAQSKEIFAEGAVNAAKFVVSKPAGLYNMADLLG